MAPKDGSTVDAEFLIELCLNQLIVLLPKDFVTFTIKQNFNVTIRCDKHDKGI